MTDHQSPPEMLAVEFGVGSGLGLIGRSTCALLDAATCDLAESLWERIDRGAGIDELMDHLSVAGLRSLGSFALLQLEDGGVRVVLRGSATAVIECDDEIDALDAAGVKTWVERAVPSCTGFRLGLTGSDVWAAGYRSASGVVPAASLSWPAPPSVPGSLAAPVDAFVAPRPAQAPVAAPSTSLPVADTVHELPQPQPDPADQDGVTLHPSRLADTTSITAAEVTATRPADQDEYDYDSLYGHTVARTVQGAAVETVADTGPPVGRAHAAGTTEPAMTPAPVPADTVPPTVFAAPATGGLISGVPHEGHASPSQPAPVAAAVGGLADGGDHDGMTITAAQLRAMRSGGAGPAPQPLAPAMGGPTVQALLCVGHAHPNPPHAGVCARCGSPLSADLHTIARPSMGRIVLTTGDVIELTRPALIGRNPKVEGRLQGEVPQTVRIDVGREISRSHAMVRLEGWQVLVEDLGSANGTTITLPGRDPRRLHAGEPMLLEHGAVIDIGGEVSGTYDSLA